MHFLNTSFILDIAVNVLDTSFILDIAVSFLDTSLIFRYCCNLAKFIIDIREGGREIRPWTHHNVFWTQIIHKIYSVPLWFYTEPLILSSEPLNLKFMKKNLRSYTILKTNSLDYHDGVHFVDMCKFWNFTKKIVWTSMLRKNVKEILFL